MISYTFRADALNPVMTYTIEDNHLSWTSEKGGSGKIEFSKIAATRLKYSPTRYKSNLFVFELIHKNGAKTVFKNITYKGIANFGEQNKEYNEFIIDLNKKLAEFDDKIIFSSGTTTALYFIYSITMIFSAIVLLGVFYFILTSGVIWIVIAHLLFMLYLLPSAIRFMKKNKPRSYNPSEIPKDMLPA